MISRLNDKGEFSLTWRWAIFHAKFHMLFPVTLPMQPSRKGNKERRERVRKKKQLIITFRTIIQSLTCQFTRTDSFIEELPFYWIFFICIFTAPAFGWLILKRKSALLFSIYLCVVCSRASKYLLWRLIEAVFVSLLLFYFYFFVFKRSFRFVRLRLFFFRICNLIFAWVSLWMF